MIRSILIIGFLFGSLTSIAQSKQNIANWLYGLPINRNAKKIKKAIQKNDCFEEDHRNISKSFQYLSSTYKGTILKPLLQNKEHLDSAKIHLEVGTLNSIDGYSGHMKWLRFEYFSADTVFLKALFDTANSELKSGQELEKPTGFRRNEDVIGVGKDFIYTNDFEKMRSVSIMIVKYITGTKSFLIQFSGSND